MSQVQQFAERENVHTASFTAIGALSDAVLLYFDLQKKDYQNISVALHVVHDHGTFCEAGAPRSWFIL